MKMEKTVKWLNEGFASKVNVFANNVWVKALQRTMISTLPIILLGSVINILLALRQVVPFIPDLSMIYYFTFYLLGLFVAIMLPYYVLEGKKLKRLQLISIITSVGVFLLSQKMDFNLYGMTGLVFTNLGPQGIVLGLLVGYFVSFVTYKFANFSFFKKDTTLPEFVTAWFDQMLPVFICYLIPFLIIYVADINLFEVIIAIFQPIQNISNTLPGFILINFLYVFFYTIGASGWILSGAFYPILMANIAANAATVAAGGVPTAIATNEVIYSGWCTLGGLGSALPLLIYMLNSKVEKLKGIAKGSFVPVLCNINEPLIYGTPVILNPILMIPMWLNSVVISTIVFITLKVGLVAIPAAPFNLGFIPYGISTFLVNYDWRGLVLLAVVALVSSIIWYPFYKAFEKQELKKQNEAELAAQ